MSDWQWITILILTFVQNIRIHFNTVQIYILMYKKMLVKLVSNYKIDSYYNLLK